jgi:hypothetical protein
LTRFIRIFGTTLSVDIIAPRRMEVANMRPLDGCPGGTTDVTGDVTVPVATFLGFGSISGDRYGDGNHEIIRTTFIPVISALDIQTSDVFLNVLNQQSPLTSGFVGSRSDPQFDAAQFIEVTVGENRVANQVHAGLSYRTTGFLLYELITKNALQTSATVALNNRTYNLGSSTYDYPLYLPQTNGFEPKRTTNIIDYTLNVTSVGQLWVNRSGKIGFTDNVNAAPNTTMNSPYSLIIRQADGCKSGTDNSLGVVSVNAGGTVLVGDISTPTNSANIRILQGGAMRVGNGGNLNVTDNAQIIVESGGRLIIDGAANINLGSNAKILIKSGGELVINGNFNFSGFGFFQFDQGHKITINADVALKGAGKTSKFFVLSDAPAGTENIMKITGRYLNLTNALVYYGSNSQIDFTNCPEVGFSNCIFSGYTTKKALNFANSNRVFVSSCDFSHMTEGIVAVGNTDVEVTTSYFADVKKCVAVKGLSTSSTQIGSCTFNFDSYNVASGIAVNLENSYADFNYNKFIGSGLENNITAILLKNTVIYASNYDKISDFKTGINAEQSNISEIVGTEISNCETGVNMMNGYIFMRSCSKLVNNITGLKGQNILFDVWGEAGNTFQNVLSNPNSLLFDICYSANDPSFASPVNVSNNYWVAGFENTKFNLTYGCSVGARRRIVQYSTLTNHCDYSNYKEECDATTLVSSDGTGIGGIINTAIQCFNGKNDNSSLKKAAVVNNSANQTASKLDSDKLTIYPNPANETVKLDIESGNYTLKVLNTVGQTIFEQNTEGSLSVNTATWTNGIYLFEVTNKATNERQRSKIVVQH